MVTLNMVTLSDDDRRAIADAVKQAEAGTSGGVCCVLTEEASQYREVPLAWAALVALALPPLALAFGLRPLALGEMVSGWAAAQTGAVARDVLLALVSYAVVQAVLFAVVALVVYIPAVRRALTPSFMKRHRVQHSARHHFVTLTARLGTGAYVMIYASRLDRMVEIVVSEAAHKICDAAAWRQAADAIGAALKQDRTGEGFVSAIAICGAELSRHFPPSTDHPNRLPDTLIEE
jgi:putative membrane protein